MGCRWLAITATLSACGDDAASDEARRADGASPSAGSSPGASPSVAATKASTAAGESLGPEESFRAWLAASREPDAREACRYLTQGLVDSMLDELERDGWGDLKNCETLTTTTAELYKAAGASSGAEVEVVSETAQRAELRVVYADSGNCGAVVLVPRSAYWVMTEQSEERC